MKRFFNFNNLLILSILGILFSCAGRKNVIQQADDILDAVTKYQQEIQQADALKFTQIEQFLKTAQTTQIQPQTLENAQLLLAETKKKQLTLEKMTSEEIDNYDESTQKLLVQLAKIQHENPASESLKKQFEQIQELDNQDLIRRIRYDRAVRRWNTLVKKSKRKLRKSKVYQQAQSLPLFAIEE